MIAEITIETSKFPSGYSWVQTKLAEVLPASFCVLRLFNVEPLRPLFLNTPQLQSDVHKQLYVINHKIDPEPEGCMERTVLSESGWCHKVWSYQNFPSLSAIFALLIVPYLASTPVEGFNIHGCWYPRVSTLYGHCVIPQSSWRNVHVPASYTTGKSLRWGLWSASHRGKYVFTELWRCWGNQATFYAMYGMSTDVECIYLFFGRLLLTGCRKFR